MSVSSSWSLCNVPEDGAEWSLETLWEYSVSNSPDDKQIIYEKDECFYAYPNIAINACFQSTEFETFFDRTKAEFLKKSGLVSTQIGQENHPNYMTMRRFLDSLHSQDPNPVQTFSDKSRRKNWIARLFSDYKSEQREWTGFDDFVLHLTDEVMAPVYLDEPDLIHVKSNWLEFIIRPLFAQLDVECKQFGISIGHLHYKFQYLLLASKYKIMLDLQGSKFKPLHHKILDYWSKILTSRDNYLDLFLYLDGHQSHYNLECSTWVQEFNNIKQFEEFRGILSYPNEEETYSNTNLFSTESNVLIGSSADCQNNLDDVLELLIEMSNRGFNFRAHVDGIFSNSKYQFQDYPSVPGIGDFFFDLTSKLIAEISSVSENSSTLSIEINDLSKIKLGGVSNQALWDVNRKYSWISKNELGQLIQRFKLTSYGYKSRSKIGLGQISEVIIDQNNRGTGYLYNMPPRFNLQRARSVTDYAEDPNIIPVIENGKIISTKVKFGGSGFLQPKGYIIGGTGLNNSIDRPGQIKSGNVLTELDLTFNQSGGVNGATIATNGSSNFSSPPKLWIHGGNLDADGTFTLDSNGKLSSVSITNAGTGYSNSETITISPPPKFELIDTDTANVYSLKLIDIDQHIETPPFQDGDSATLYNPTSPVSVKISRVGNHIQILNPNDDSIITTSLASNHYLIGQTALVSDVSYSISPMWEKLIGSDGLKFSNRTSKDKTEVYTVNESLRRTLIQYYCDGSIHKLALTMAQFRTEFGNFERVFESGNYSINVTILKLILLNRIKYGRIDSNNQSARNNIRLQIEANLLQDMTNSADWPKPKANNGYDRNFSEKWEIKSHSLYDQNGNFSYDKDTNLANLSKEEFSVEKSFHTISSKNYLEISDVSNLETATSNALRFDNIFIPKENSNSIQFRLKSSGPTYDLVDYIERNNNANFPEVPSISLLRKSDNENYYSVEVNGTIVLLDSISTTGSDITFAQYNMTNPTNANRLVKAACHEGYFDHSRRYDDANNVWITPRYPAKYRGRGFIQATHQSGYGNYNLGPFQGSSIQSKPCKLAYYSILGGEWSMQFLHDKKFSFCRSCNIVHSSPSWSGCGNSGHITTQHPYWGFSILSPQQDTFLDDHGNRKFSDIDYPGISGLSYRVNGTRKAIDDNKRSKNMLTTLLTIYGHVNGISLSKSAVHEIQSGEGHIYTKGGSEERKQLLRFFADQESTFYPHDVGLLSNAEPTRWVKFPRDKHSNYIENKSLLNTWCTADMRSLLIYSSKLFFDETGERVVIHSLSPEAGGWNGLHSKGYEFGTDACISFSPSHESTLKRILRNEIKNRFEGLNCRLLTDSVETLPSSANNTFFRLTILSKFHSKNAKSIWESEDKNQGG